MKSFFSIILTLLLWSDLQAHSGYIGYSDAPGSNGACSRSCHHQFAFTPEITVTGFPEVYQPGEQYIIAVAHQSDYAINQFNASVRVGDGSENAGILTAGEATETYDTANETNGVHWAAVDSDSGTFIWTAPEPGTGEVRLYWAGLQGSRSFGADTQAVLISSEYNTAVDYIPGSPNRLSLGQNYPNPFNDNTIIEISLPRASQVRFVITDILGRQVYRLEKETDSPGHLSIRWDGRESSGRILPSGIYFYRLITPEGTITRKMMLLR
jgi:hypothetical protein